MKIFKHFDVVHRYHIPSIHWADTTTKWNDGTKDGWENDFRQWCQDNLQAGWMLHEHFNGGWFVNVVDESDYDILIIAWGK